MAEPNHLRIITVYTGANEMRRKDRERWGGGGGNILSLPVLVVIFFSHLSNESYWMKLVYLSLRVVSPFFTPFPVH